MKQQRKTGKRMSDTASPNGRQDAPLRAALTAALAILPALGMPRSGEAASFDCETQALQPDEKAICDNRALNDADVKMVTTFDLLSGLLAMGSRGAMQDEQTEWLKHRQACAADVACIKAAYDARQKQLNQTYSKIDRPL
jgi:uncharacterized protein